MFYCYLNNYFKTILLLFILTGLLGLFSTAQGGGIELPPPPPKTVILLGGQYNYATYQLPQKPLFGSNGIARSPVAAPLIESSNLDDSGWGAYLGFSVASLKHLAVGGLVTYDDYGHARYHVTNNLEDESFPEDFGGARL